MRKYEMIREIFNSCENNKMRDVAIEEIETDDPGLYMERFMLGSSVKCSMTTSADGTEIYELETDGIMQRITFTEVG